MGVAVRALELIDDGVCVWAPLIELEGGCENVEYRIESPRRLGSTYVCHLTKGSSDLLLDSSTMTSSRLTT